MPKRSVVSWMGLLAATGVLARAPLDEVLANGGRRPGRDRRFLIATGVTRADSDTYRPGRPAVGFDGARYLVVSCRDAVAPAGVFGVFVSLDAKVSAPFHIASTPCGARPEVAFDGVNYLVAFTAGGELRGMRVSPEGLLLDAPSGFLIGPNGSGSDPAIAFGGTNYLIVWSRYLATPHDPFGGYDVFGARVSSEGVVLDASPLTIFAAAGEQVFPAVAFDGASHLVVWRDTRAGSGPGANTDIFGSRISTAGVNLDPAGIAIATAPDSQGAPAVAFGAGHYLVAWIDVATGSFPQPTGIFAARLSPEGDLLDGPPGSGGIAVNTFDGGSKGAPRVDFDGVHFMVVWSLGAYNSPAGIRAAKVSPAGSVLLAAPGGEGLSLSSPDCYACRLVHPNVRSTRTSNRSNTLVAWLHNSEVSGTTKDLRGGLYPRAHRAILQHLEPFASASACPEGRC